MAKSENTFTTPLPLAGDRVYRQELQPLVRSMAASGLREQRLLSLSSDARVSLDIHCPTLQDDDMVVTRNMDPASKGYGSVGVHVKPESMLRLLQHFPSFNSLMLGKVRLSLNPKP